MEPRLFTTTEASILLHVSRQTVATWVREGHVNAGRTPGDGRYRFKLEDINAARLYQGLDPLTEDEAALLLEGES